MGQVIVTGRLCTLCLHYHGSWKKSLRQQSLWLTLALQQFIILFVYYMRTWCSTVSFLHLQFFGFLSSSSLLTN